MFKNDYAAFRYIAISTLLKAAPVKYGKSYLYTETDEMDDQIMNEYESKVPLTNRQRENSLPLRDKESKFKKMNLQRKQAK